MSRIVKSSSDVNGLISNIYDVIDDPGRLDQALKSIAQSVSCKSTALVVSDDSKQNCNIHAQYNTDPHWINLYNNHYYQYDPSIHIFNDHRNIIIPDHVTCSNRTRLSGNRKLFYNELMRPQKFYHTAACQIKVQGSLSKCVWIWTRTRKQGYFSNSELNILAGLGAHMSRALGLRAAICESKTKELIFETIIEQSKQALILINNKGIPIFLNCSAHRLQKQYSLFEISSTQGIKIKSSSYQLAFKNLINGAIKQHLYASNIGGGAITIHDTAIKLKITVSSLSHATPTSWDLRHHAAAIIVITEEKTPSIYHHKNAANDYKLTNAEIRLLKLLVEGNSVREIASILHKSILTLRTQLKSIMRKTNTHKQSDLIRLFIQ